MPSDKTSRACRANDPSSCRYHRTLSYVGDAVRMTELAYTSSYWRSRSESSAAFEKIRESITSITKEAITEVNEKVNSGEVTVNGRGRDFQYAIKEALDKASRSATVPREFYSDFAIGHLEKPIFYQFQRSVKSPERHGVNVLDATAEAEPFDQAAGLMLQEKGQWVNPTGDGYYGSWADETGTAHFKDCGPAYIGKPEEDSWSTFAGTFVDHSDTEHGMGADAECNCGALKGRVRIQDNFTDLTRSLVNDYAPRLWDNR